jgi:hypothetical protein
MAVLTGTDFFTVEVLTWKGLATYYVLFFIQLESRRVTIAGLTPSNFRVDGPDGPQRNGRDFRLSAWAAISPS